MGKIELLSQDTIDKIAAGEVIERPSSVVKELVENAIDAGATAITVEIKEGGTSFIRITDNGSGIAKEDISLAFLRHSTSKIKSAEDLMCVNSLGFRGEALSSIAAVARVELITKTRESLTGTRYLIEGSKEISKEEIGAPDGTTFLVRDLFFNTPARRKFLKTAQTEGTYISDMLEKLALSHPDISFQYINNNQTRLHSSGNGSRKDLVYHIYGRDITAALLEINYRGTWFSVTGFLGKPQINRGNRNYENYFINGRYIKSTLLSKAIEEGYKSFLMQHQYPFTVLYFSFPSETLDVNVHPTKMELRFDHNKEVYQELVEAVYGVLSHRELIPEVPIDEKKEKKLPPVYKESIPEPFEKRRINQLRSLTNTDFGSRGLEYKTVNQQLSKETGNHSHCYTDTKEGEQYHPVMNTAQKAAESVSVYDSRHDSSKETVAGKGAPEKNIVHTISPQPAHHSRKEVSDDSSADKQEGQSAPVSGNPDNNAATEQLTLASMSPDFLTEDARKKHRIIGQLFATYWLIEYEDKLYIMDQHAAHEKVLYERINICMPNIKRIKNTMPELYEGMVQCRIWSIIASSLLKDNENVGALLVFNPRRHIEESMLVQMVAEYLNACLLRESANEICEKSKTHDSLTGLWNRNSFVLWKKEREIQGYQSLGIITTDIIKLSDMNHQFGYLYGNKKLIEVAEILKETFDGYRLFRYDQDEMLVLCANIKRKDFISGN